jgi:hypothetical protein
MRNIQIKMSFFYKYLILNAPREPSGFAVFGGIGERSWLSKVTRQGDQGYGGTKSRTICKQKPADRQRIRKGKMEPITSQTSPLKPRNGDV